MSDVVASSLSDLEARLDGGDPFTQADVERILGCADLISVGLLGEAARRRASANRVMFGQVAVSLSAAAAIEVGEAGEVRLLGLGDDLAAAVTRVAAARASAGPQPLTGFSLAEIVTLAGGDHLAVADISKALAAAGLEGLAEVPLDGLGETDNVIEVVRAATHGGLGVWRATVTHAGLADRAGLIERAAVVQEATGAFKAFAPLPTEDPRDAPATGYDDVRTIAAARVRCRNIPSIQVDWLLYGPKLAQVAIAYGADDLDGASAVDVLQLGPRRSPREDLERQIRAAFAEPARRNGRFELAP